MGLNAAFAERAAKYPEGIIAYLESGEGNTTRALLSANIDIGRLVAVTHDAKAHEQLTRSYPQLQTKLALWKDYLTMEMRPIACAWADYCCEIFGRVDQKTGAVSSPPTEIHLALRRLARVAARGPTALAITTAHTRLPPGRAAGIRAALLAAGIDPNLAAGRKALQPKTFIRHVVAEAAGKLGLAVRETAKATYASSSTGGFTMSYIEFEVVTASRDC
jgi:hypothetical protein